MTKSTNKTSPSPIRKKCNRFWMLTGQKKITRKPPLSVNNSNLITTEWTGITDEFIRTYPGFLSSPYLMRFRLMSFADEVENAYNQWTGKKCVLARNSREIVKLKKAREVLHPVQPERCQQRNIQPSLLKGKKYVLLISGQLVCPRRKGNPHLKTLYEKYASMDSKRVSRLTMHYPRKVEKLIEEDGSGIFATF